MKKIIFFISAIFIISATTIAQNNVGIGTTTPDASAVLDITSTTKGLLIPRMTTAERTVIASPAKGLMVFDNNTNTYWFYNGTLWVEMNASGAGASPWATNGNDIYNNNSGNTGIGITSPTVKLDVNSTTNHTARFNSTSNQMYVGFYENGSIRGYAGSYSGAAEDFDLGTASTNTTGKLHLTIQASPKMTIDNTGAVGISNTAPDASAILDINSTAKGLLIPRMATTERTAIISPAKGLMVFDNTTSTFWFYNGAMWTELNGSGGNFSLPYSGSDASTESFMVTNTLSAGTAIYGKATSTNPNSIGILGEGTGGSSVGVRAKNTNGFAIYADGTPTATLNPVIKGMSNSATYGVGVMGESNGVNGRGVYGASAAGIAVEGYGNNAGAIGVKGNSLSGTGVKAYSFTGTALDVEGNLKIAGGNTNPANGAVLTSDATGNAVWKPKRVAFNVSGTSTNVANATTVNLSFTNENYDAGSNYNLAGAASNPNSFVAPVSGYYHFDLSFVMNLQSLTTNIGSVIATISRNGADIYIMQGFGHSSAIDSKAPFSESTGIHLNAGDVIRATAYQSNATSLTATIQNASFSGYLVFAD